jgi:hypothetical protein
MYEGFALEANAIVLDARIRDGDEPDCFIAGADVRDIDTECFQAGLELLDAEIVIVQHDWFSFIEMDS